MLVSAATVWAFENPVMGRESGTSDILVTGDVVPALPLKQEPIPLRPGQLAPAPDQTAPRAPGVMKLPNTVSAPPFTVSDKFEYRIVQSFGLRGLVGAAVAATIGQAVGTPRAWGGGVEGYAERYGSGFAGNLSRQSFAFVLEAALREDPRYFASQDQELDVRFLNAVKQIFICKTDAGHSSFAYGRVISAFGAGQFVNIWQPASTGSVSDGLRRGAYGLGADFVYNLAQEFLPFARPKSLRHRH